MPDIVDRIPWTPKFKVVREIPRSVEIFDTSDGKDTSSACEEALTELYGICKEKDLFKVIRGRPSELFAIVDADYPVRIERFFSPLFGIISRGAHLTAYVRTPEGLKIWVPRRSASMPTYPSMLDSTVAGGVPASQTPFENIIQEANEEASLPADLVRRDIKSVGVLTYMSRTDKGARAEPGLIIPDMIYLYDIELSPTVIPKPHDTEVMEFYLMSVDEVKERMLNKEFKTNCSVVMIDFFIRHGIITNDNEKDFVEINMRMHRRLPFKTASRRGGGNVPKLT